jgi:hypothetical protein
MRCDTLRRAVGLIFDDNALLDSHSNLASFLQRPDRLTINCDKFPGTFASDRIPIA